MKAFVAAVVTLLLFSTSTGCEYGATTPSPSACAKPPGGCTLRQIGRRVHIKVGAAVPAGPVNDDGIDRQLLLSEFNSVTPEYQATWTALEPRRGHVDYRPLDALVRLARQHGVAVRGHALVWDQAHELPGWVAAISDPTRLRQALEQHIHDVVSRYRGRIDRWDVVNEPLQTSGSQLHHGHLYDVLGPDYISDAFTTAHAADPAASLWLNENNTEVSPGKADALVALAAQLTSSGVPISGVGLQTHLLSGHAPSAGVIANLIGRLRALGLQVAITELDVPVPRSGSTKAQVAAFAQVARECRAAGCSEITTWGLDDSHTWLDAKLHRKHTDPLLFNAVGKPKAAFYAFRDALWAQPAR